MKILYVTLIALLLASCRLQVISPQGGNVTWDGGECLEGNVCAIDIDDINFSKTFSATAKSGYEFVGWEYVLRPNNNPLTPIPLECNTAQCIVGFDIITDEVASILIESLDQGFITPVYRALYVEPTPPPTPEPPPPPPEPTTSCSDSDVVCGYDIPSYQMEQTSTSSLLITIPAGKTVSQAFTTTAAPVTYGRFVFHQVTGEISPSIDMWISNAPNGEPISLECLFTNGLKASEFNWMVSEPYLNWWCEMESETKYYLNVKHSNPNLPSSSRIERLIKVTSIGDLNESSTN